MNPITQYRARIHEAFDKALTKMEEAYNEHGAETDLSKLEPSHFGMQLKVEFKTNKFTIVSHPRVKLHDNPEVVIQIDLNEEGICLILRDVDIESDGIYLAAIEGQLTEAYRQLGHEKTREDIALRAKEVFETHPITHS